MNFKIFTIFPEIFPGYLDHSVIGDALRRKLWSFDAIDIRGFAVDNRKTVDDYPYGGGCGMVMKPDVISSAIDANLSKDVKIIYPSPRGVRFDQKIARDLSKEKQLAFLCGRYEGVDQRVIDEYDMMEVSLGDYILTGGELPVMVMMDAILRNIEAVLGDKDSISEESFCFDELVAEDEFRNLLEYPQYTKPRIWKNRKVPEILLSGHHKNIKNWRLEEAKKITQKRRPDLLK